MTHVTQNIINQDVSVVTDTGLFAMAVSVEGIPNVNAVNLPLAAFGELLVAQVSPQTAWRHDYGTVPNTRIVGTTIANGGTVTVADSEAVLSTGTNANGSAIMRSKRALRYVPGFGALVRFTAVYTQGVANNAQLAGIGDAQDGFFFGYSGTVFGIFHRRAGVTTFISQTNWNGTPVAFTPTLGNVYQIRYQWLGFGFIRFYVEHPQGQQFGFILVHTIVYPNTATAPSILNPTLPLYAQVVNTGNTSNVTLKTPSAMGAVEGVFDTTHNPLDIPNSFDTALTLANTNNNHALTIRDKAVFGGVANRIPLILDSITVARSSSGANTSTIRLYRNATTTIPLVYTDVDTNNSPVDASTTTTTITSTNAERAYTVTINVTSTTIPFDYNQVLLDPSETLSIGITSSGVQSTDFVITFNWLEAF